MQNPELTKDAKVLLGRLYNAYRARRDSGSESRLTTFDNVFETFMPEVSVTAATEAFRSLAAAGFVRNYYESDEIATSTLLPRGIAYVENSTSQTIKDVVSTVQTIKDVVNTLSQL